MNNLDLEQPIKIFVPVNRNVEIHYFNCSINNTENNIKTTNKILGNILSDEYYKMVEENCKKSGGDLI